MRIAFCTLGCKVNQYETQALERLFAARGHVSVPFEGEADAYIVNSCTVTAVSDKKSRQTVRQAFHLFFFGEQDQLGVRLFLCDQRPQYGGDIYTPQICQNDIGFGGQIFLGIAALLKRMDKRFQRRHSF